MQTLTFAPRTVARFAGLMYHNHHRLCACAGLGVREAMLVRRIRGHGLQHPGGPVPFRLGFVADLVMALCDVAVGVAFFVLLRPLSFGLSFVAAFLRLAQASAIGINLLNHFWPVLLPAGRCRCGLRPDQLHALVMLFLQAHATGYLIGGCSSGSAALVLGYLLFRGSCGPALDRRGHRRCRFLAYLLDCTANFLFPDLTTYTELLMLVTVAGELSSACTCW